MAVDLNHATYSFESFFRQWLLNQEEYLRQLLSARHHGGQQQQELESLLSRVLRHYQNYYDEKSRCAHVDVLQFFSPLWLTALEKTFLWIGGWKPSLAFRILDNSVGGLSPEEMRSIQQLRAETRVRELELTEELAKIQESLGGQTVLEQAKRVGKLKDGVGREVEVVLEPLHLSLEALLEAADSLRVSTVKKIVEILGEVRTVDFLAAAAQLHLGIRRKGMQRETGWKGEGEAR
ncbi:protein ZW2-like [Aristolochia californica]|uniref:protein ZW2-like n=1 Tax=Aristolochia californica TaxID=171875 RepID=UPI0035E2D63F